MRLPNVKRLLYLAEKCQPESCQNAIIDFDTFEGRYPFRPNGVNYYIGVGFEMFHRLRDPEVGNRRALSDEGRALFEMTLAAMDVDEQREKVVDISLEPLFVTPHITPFDFVLAYPEMLQQLSRELGDYQARARAKNRSLHIVVRYASEMNDAFTPGQPYGRPIDIACNGLMGADLDHHVEQYKTSFMVARTALRSHAKIDVAFSPALRSDIMGPEYNLIDRYWPGDGEVDVVSCTWYVGEKDDLDGAAGVMRRYFADFGGRAELHGIDEMGGANGQQGNDEVLEAMFQQIVQQPITFDYITLFLQHKWGADATLEFLRDWNS